MSVVYFLLLVGVLVVIHELGHFVAAKLLDVKVLRFSLGYGRPLVRVKLRETEYQIGVFPLGGYVRIFGIEGEGTAAADAGRSFAGRPLWQRLVIVFAGPAANLVLPIIIYFVFFAGHSVLPAAQIGDVLDGGAAARAGIEPGDKVVEIDGRNVRYWEDIEAAVASSPGQELHLVVQRNGKRFERYLTPLEATQHKRDGSTTVQGWVDISHAPIVPLVGVLDESSPAALAGMKTGDLIISIDGQAVRNWSEVEAHLGKFARRASIVYFRGAEVPGIPQIHLLGPSFADLVPQTQVDSVLKRQSYTGLEHAEMFVARVDPGSPADAAGMHVGDFVTALDATPVAHWRDLDQRLQADPKKTYKVSWRRAVAGKIEAMTAEMTQVERSKLDEYDHTISRLEFGAYNDADRGNGAMVAIDGRFGYAMSKALERTGDTVSTMVTGFVKILEGDAPSDAISGPIMMYKVASVSGNQGWDSFLLMLALISINLGLINLLPVPMLDGGHVLVFAIEGLRRKPLSQQARDRVQLVGLALIGVITILALGNDIIHLVK